ncbi:GNAT family N-acetyltransferase [Ruegeria sp. SCP11]|uniref:GNAT family N-acetyltransferase n=1 Tax=Ruegeria sp. SCP11 TaxID=3141378 RepID=UPI00333DFCE2
MNTRTLATVTRVKNIPNKATSIDTRLVLADKSFNDWNGLLDLMRKTFSQNIGRIDPPSTVFECTTQDLQNRSHQELLLLVYNDLDLVGCLFMRPGEEDLFLGRFAIVPQMQGMGLARRMIAKAEQVANQSGLRVLALETRIELLTNQRKFKALGFEIVSGRAHTGFDRITTLRMQKRIEK